MLNDTKRDLTAQASNGTYGSASLKAIQSEIEARFLEISRIANKHNKLAPVSSLRIFEANIATLTKSHSFEGAKKALRTIKQQGFNAIELIFLATLE